MNEQLHLALLSEASRNVRGRAVRRDLMVWNPIERTWFDNQPLRIDRILFVIKRAFHETFKRRSTAWRAKAGRA